MEDYFAWEKGKNPRHYNFGRAFPNLIANYLTKMDEVRKKWAEQGAPSPRANFDENSEKIAAARKVLLRVVNWDLNDDKHRKLEQIKDTVEYLMKILGNVRDHPTEEKYRRVRSHVLLQHLLLLSNM